MTALLEAHGIARSFPWKHGRRLQAVAGVDLTVARGECLALVGESGSGKTTLGRCLLRLLEPDAGEIRFEGSSLTGLSKRQLRRRRRRFQMVFQDSAGALDPRMRVGSAIAEPIRAHRLAEPRAVTERVASLLDTVGLAASLAERYPHQLSGGQRQRVGIARALATEPRLLILDEPVSALDVSVRAQILGLLDDLRRKLSLTMIFIAHDLAVVDQIADRVAVMYFGRLVEIGPARDVLSAPGHPYTASLLRAVPVPDPTRRLRPEAGKVVPEARQRNHGAPEASQRSDEIPSLLDPPSGCPFHPRCHLARRDDGGLRGRCVEQMPDLAAAADGRSVACHYPPAPDAEG